MKSARKAFRNTVERKANAGRRRYWIVGAAVLVGLVGAAMVAGGSSPRLAADERVAAPLPPDPAGAAAERAERLPERLNDPPGPPPAEPPAEPAPLRLAQKAVAAEAASPPAARAPLPPPVKTGSAPKAPSAPSKFAPKGRLSLPLLKPPAASSSANPLKIPLAGAPPADRVSIEGSDGRISLAVNGVPLNEVLMVLAQQQNLNIVCAENLRTSITVTLEKVPLSTALDSILAIAGCSWVRENDVIYVTSVTDRTKVAAGVQGRQVRVFRLDFASAADVEKAVKGMLSPVGQCFTSASKATDNRQTQEIVVVEDVPGYLRVIEQCVEQIDQPPRQVMIEAHVLAVTLDSNDRCGVNLTALFKVLNHDMKFYAQGIANPTAPQAFFFSYDGSDLDMLIEALRTQSNAKTLASPKVLVLNGQEAKIQVGRQLGFRVVTTTETSSMESINFLDVGVVLTVTPRISRDGQVLMRVKPEVSKGEVNPDTGLPEEDTTHVETNIMLPDGRGMVIGGLIQEKDIETQSKVAFLGDIYLVGKLFRRRELTKQRQEIIITLVPRIVPSELACGDRHSIEVQQAETPLVDRNLERVCRPWDGMLPDAIENPAHLGDLPAVKHHAEQKHGRPCPDAEAPSTACGEAEPYYGGAPIERNPR